MTQPSDHDSSAGGDNGEPLATVPGASPTETSPSSPPDPPGSRGEPVVQRPRPSYLFLGIVAIVSLAADLGTKWWALHSLEKTLPNGGSIPQPLEITPWLTLLLARNRGGAWGLLQSASEGVRKPFFLIISVAAIIFIVYLYRRIHPKQHALKWGLPLVLGGAIGNLVDRIRYGWVIDFIDYRAEWVRWLNEQIAKIWSTHAVTDHWPTYNIADVAICIGVGLMAIDMFTSRKHTFEDTTSPRRPATPSAEPGIGADTSVSEPAPPPSDGDPPPEQSKV